MTISAVLALLLCTQPALGQTRPQLSEVFHSPVTIEITTGAGPDAETVEGVGEVWFDQPAGKAREVYRFPGGPPVEIITRYDLGQIFRIDPPGCEVEEVTAPMPLFWGWIAQAKQGDVADEVNGLGGTEWRGTASAPAPQQTVGATNDGRTALYYEETTPERTVRITFLDWQTTFDEKPNLFKPPRRCPK
jgi:hypothetical protein